MKSKVIQEFKGTINGIELSDRDLFYDCEYILQELEDQFDIDLPTSFINDFIHAYKSIFYDLGSEYVYEFRSHMSSSSWIPICKILHNCISISDHIMIQMHNSQK